MKQQVSELNSINVRDLEPRQVLAVKACRAARLCGARVTHPQFSPPGDGSFYSQCSGSLARAWAEHPVVTTSISVVARLSGGTTSTRSAVPPSIPLWPRVRVACQRPPLSRIHVTGQ